MSHNYYNVEPPAGQLRLASAATTNFTASLLAAVARMLPSTLLSTGGDEVNTNCYAQDSVTQAELNATGRSLNQALDDFTKQTHSAIIAEGKTPIVWEGRKVLDIAKNPFTFTFFLSQKWFLIIM